MSDAKTNATTADEAEAPANFIRDMVVDDVDSGRFDGSVVTRFPPEPNGYLHIGHAFAATVSFTIASEFGGRFNLRFDDTNPTKENIEFVEAQQRDLKWLGLDWGETAFHAADYFQQMHDHAVTLIKQGKAYVCQLSIEEIREYRGNFTTLGRNSPYRDRPVEENLALFAKMKNGGFKDGEAVLRAKIDMQSPNLNLRDPVMYRIYHAHHYRTGNDWCIYPIYDWAHCLEDSIEGVTHSLCSLEFENHRPLYDWYLDQLGVHHPQQIEFSRMNLSHTLMGKRKLMQLVEAGHATGWDDPRMPTVSGVRRRGYPPEALRAFLQRLGVSKSPTAVDVSLLEYYVREYLNEHALRAMAVLEPLKVVITNYPEGEVEWLEAENNPGDASAGVRKMPFSRELYIERDDFMEDPPKKYFRLSPGKEIRLKHAYYITCTDVVKDDAGEIVELHCTYDPESKGGSTPDGRKVRGTSHWVSASHAIEAEVRMFDRLFTVERPDKPEEGKSFLDYVNPDSLKVLRGCKLEPSLAKLQGGERVQFMRKGYFCVDSEDSKPDALVFNLTVGLRDSWAKLQKKLGKKKS